MEEALVLAKQAGDLGEVPVGAVLVQGDSIIARGMNQCIASHDPTAHAEIMVLRQAGQLRQNYRLLDTDLYVTLEPCVMCVGALVHARIRRLIFGAFDSKQGAAQSAGRFFELPHLNHRVEVIGGVMAETCGTMLKEFFQARR